MTKDHETLPSTSGSGELSDRMSRPFRDMRQEIEDLFEDFYSGNALAPFWRRAPKGSVAARLGALAAAPKLDVIDKEDEVKIVAEIPGMAQDDINVQVNHNTLTLSGEKTESSEEGDKHGEYYLSERRFGSFKRTIPLPEGIDQDKVDAQYKNGVLTVRLPKKPEAQHPTRKIAVKSA